MEAAYDVGSHDITDPSEQQAEHIPVKKLSIGSWNLLAKYDEHVLLSFYWAERKLVWEVLHLGVVRKMEVDFEDIAQITHSSGSDEAQPDKLVIELHRPPRFFKENPPSAVSGGSQEVNYVYTTDFTNGQASTESRHVLLFDPGTITRETTKMLTSSGIRLVSEGAMVADASAAGPSRGGLLRGASGVHATSAHLRQPPTSSPRLDAILLQDQLKREMRERQARYTGICPVSPRAVDIPERRPRAQAHVARTGEGWIGWEGGGRVTKRGISMHTHTHTQTRARCTRAIIGCPPSAATMPLLPGGTLPLSPFRLLTSPCSVLALIASPLRCENVSMRSSSTSSSRA